MRLKITTLNILFCITILAQNTVIKIWQNKIPGEIKSSSYSEFIVPGNKALLYTKVTNPTLTFFEAPKKTNTGAAVIICPGGGYRILSFDQEGIQVAKYFNSIGISAFVLKYRLPHDSIMEDKSVGPLQDAQEAIRIVRRNAVKYGIQPSKIGIVGFSAGGHLASTAATHFQEKVYDVSDSTSARPDFAVLVYPVITMGELTHKGSHDNLLGKNPSKEQIARFSNELQVNAQTPPIFLVHASNDRTVSVLNCIHFYEACIRNNVSAEMHIYEKGGHGFGLATGVQSSQSQWPLAMAAWLKNQGVIVGK